MVTIEDAKKILSKNGKNYTDEEIEIILKFLKINAKIAIQARETTNNKELKKIENEKT